MDGNWQRKMCHANNEEQKTPNDDKSEKIRTLREKETYKYLGI